MPTSTGRSPGRGPATTVASPRCSCASVTPSLPTRPSPGCSPFRGTPEAAADVLGPSDDGHVLAPVPLPHPPVSAPEAWPARVAAMRGIRRVLLALGPVDVLHLRMADVGTLAAQAVAQHLGIPVVFTLAPDPHEVLHAMDMTGAPIGPTSAQPTSRSTTGSAPGSCSGWPPTPSTSCCSHARELARRLPGALRHRCDERAAALHRGP